MTRDRMKTIIVILQITTFSVFLSSCIHDDPGKDCGVYLEFIYDYNIEYVDLFSPQVDVVDAFVFDADGKYLFNRRNERAQLINGNQMLLGTDLPLGTYQVLTIGGLSDKFVLSDATGGELMPGITSVEQVTLSLLTEQNEVSHEFPHIWFGQVITIENTIDKHVYPVNLIKNTNKFNLTLVEEDKKRSTVQTDRPPYTFEIVTPESAVYSYKNEPVVEEIMSYKPYYLAPGTEPDNISVGDIKTCRLFYRDDYDYRLIVRDTKSQKVLWDYSLMVLLLNTKRYPEMPMQEYLDRQSEWNIAILYKGGQGGLEGFIAIGVEINDWIVWLRDIEI